MAIKGFFPGSIVHIMNSVKSLPSHVGDVPKIQWDHTGVILPE